MYKVIEELRIVSVGQIKFSCKYDKDFPQVVQLAERQ